MATTTTESLARSERFSLRLRPHEMAALRRVASQEQMRLSEFVRSVLLRAGASTDGTGPEGFRVVRTITEVTANRMLGYLSTIAADTTNMARIMLAERGITMPTVTVQPPSVRQLGVDFPVLLQGGDTYHFTHHGPIVGVLELETREISPQDARYVGEEFGHAVLKVLDSDAGTRIVSRRLSNSIDNYRRGRGMQEFRMNAPK